MIFYSYICISGNQKPAEHPRHYVVFAGIISSTHFVPDGPQYLFHVSVLWLLKCAGWVPETHFGVYAGSERCRNVYRKAFRYNVLALISRPYLCVYLGISCVVHAILNRSVYTLIIGPLDCSPLSNFWLPFQTLALLLGAAHAARYSSCFTFR